MAMLAFVFTAVAQGPLNGFFKPVKLNPAVKGLGTRAGSSVWLLRPTVELSALQLVWNKENKAFDTKFINSAGLGVGYQHFIDNQGEPYNNYGFNALLLFDVVPTETTATTVSGAITVSVFELVNIGAGYNFGLKLPFLLSGITLKF